MKTVQEAINSFRNALTDLYDKQETDAISYLVLCEISGSSKAKLKAFPETTLTDLQAKQLSGIIEQLKTGEPVQYILGSTEFYGLTFNISPAVLIPRPETEELVNWILASVNKPSPRIVDIGTGSGCIAISLKHELQQSNVSAIDISADALKIARQNAVSNLCDVTFIEADILNSDKLDFKNKFDIIVSNPPYVTETDKRQMHTNVTSFEPHLALFVPETDPLLFYNAIANFAAKKLIPEGLLYFEINENYGAQIIAMLKSKAFRNLEIRKDIRGKDRMVKASPPDPLKEGE